MLIIHLTYSNISHKMNYLFYLLVIFVRTLSAKKTSELKYQELMQQLKSYSEQKQLLPHMKDRLLEYYYHRFRNSYFREERILAELTGNLQPIMKFLSMIAWISFLLASPISNWNFLETLRQETALRSCRRLIEKVMLFQDLPKKALQSIVSKLKLELYLPNDVIVKAGTQGDCMYFISYGIVAILTPTGKEVDSSALLRIHYEKKDSSLGDFQGMPFGGRWTFRRGRTLSSRSTKDC
jgi:hypothetical protein